MSNPNFEKRLTHQLTNRIPPFLWPLFFSFVVSGLTFYNNISLAMRIASMVYTTYQLANLSFDLLTEETVLTSDLENTWLTKLTIPRTIIEQRNHFKDNIDFTEGDSHPLKQRYYDYTYVVRIPTPLNRNNYYVSKYFFIPLFKLGIIKEPYLYYQDLIDFATDRSKIVSTSF